MQPQNYKLLVYQVEDDRGVDADFTRFIIDPDHEAYNDGSFEWHSFLRELNKIITWLDDHCGMEHDYNDLNDGICLYLSGDKSKTTGREGAVALDFSSENKPMAVLFKLTFC